MQSHNVSANRCIVKTMKAMKMMTMRTMMTMLSAMMRITRTRTTKVILRTISFALRCFASQALMQTLMQLLMSHDHRL